MEQFQYFQFPSQLDDRGDIRVGEVVESPSNTTCGIERITRQLYTASGAEICIGETNKKIDVASFSRHRCFEFFFLLNVLVVM